MFSVVTLPRPNVLEDTLVTAVRPSMKRALRYVSTMLTLFTTTTLLTVTFRGPERPYHGR
jgi:hypothetical protein